MKNNKVSLFGSFILLVLIICIIAVAVRFAGGWIVDLIESVSSFDAVVIVALFTGFLSIFGVVVTKVLERRQNTKRYLVEKREQLYSEIIEFMFRLLQESKNKNPKKPDMKIGNELLKLTGKLTLWGSNGVLRSWAELRDVSQKGQYSTSHLLHLMEKLFFEMRKDMGQSRLFLADGDILKLFISDLDDIKKQAILNNDKRDD